MAGLLVLVGGITWWADANGHSATRVSYSRPSPETGTTAKPVRARWVPGAPHRIRIPAIHVNAAVIPVRAPSGTLVPPSDPKMLGWWAQGALPGAARGSTLLAGHTVHTGGGALNHLARVRPGDPIVLTTSKERIRYRVVAVRTFLKGTIARRAAGLFSQKVPGRLVVVTCADWNGSRYLSNTVVTARPVS